MNFKDKTVLEIYEIIKNDPIARKAAKERIKPSSIRNTLVCDNIKDAVELYNKNYDVKPVLRRAEVSTQGLSVTELVNLIISDETSLRSIRSAVTPSNEHKVSPGQLAIYKEALKRRNIFVKQQRQLLRMIKNRG